MTARALLEAEQLRDLSKQLGYALVRVLQEDYEPIIEMARTLQITFHDGEPCVAVIASSLAEQPAFVGFASVHWRDDLARDDLVSVTVIPDGNHSVPVFAGAAPIAAEQPAKGEGSTLADWWRENVKPGTVISDPEWWLVRLQRYATPQPSDPADADLVERFRLAARTLIRERKVYGEDVQTLGDVLNVLQAITPCRYEWYDAKVDTWKPINRLPHTWECELGIEWREATPPTAQRHDVVVKRDAQGLIASVEVDGKTVATNPEYVVRAHGAGAAVEAALVRLRQLAGMVEYSTSEVTMTSHEAVMAVEAALSTQPLPQPDGVSDEMVETVGSGLYIYWNDVNEKCRNTYRAKVRGVLEAALHPDQAKDGAQS